MVLKKKESYFSITPLYLIKNHLKHCQDFRVKEKPKFYNPSNTRTWVRQQIPETLNPITSYRFSTAN